MAKKGSVLIWNCSCVLTSMPESQQPKLGCEWYQPTMWCVPILLVQSV